MLDVLNVVPAFCFTSDARGSIKSDPLAQLDIVPAY